MVDWKFATLWLCFFSAAAGLTLTHVRNEACQTLSSQYPELLYWPGTSKYINETRSFYSQATILEPYCVFSPRSSSDVASAVGILKSFQTEFAVRGNGHMPVKNAASTNRGALIVLTRLKELSLNSDASIAALGPGLTWNTVYDFIQPYNKTILGGRYVTVGVSGFLLGGGISHYSSKFGWGANSVVDFEVVTADAKIVHANKTSNSDLFSALKGGSSNFGIVTRFHVKTYDASPKLFAGNLVHDSDAVPQVVSAFQNFVSSGGGIEDPDSTVLPNILIDPVTGTMMSDTFVFNTGSDTTYLKNFTSIPSVSNTASIRKYNDALAESYPLSAERRYRNNFWATSLKASARSVEILMETLKELGTSQLRDVSGSQVVLSLQSISPSFLQAARKSGGDAMDLDPSDGGFIAFNLYLRWSDAKDDPTITEYAHNFLDAVDKTSQAEDLHYPFLYLNDAAAGENPFATYGKGMSLKKMRAIRKKYDPSAVFQYLLPGGFKIGT